MKNRGTRGERLLNTEQVGAELANQGSPTVARLSGAIPRRPVKLAYTTTSGTYPSTGNKFEIMFVNASYTEAQGSQTPTTSDRQPSPAAWVLNISNDHIPENTLIEVFQVGSQWYTHWMEGTPGADDKLVKISADEPTGTASTGEYLADQFWAHNATEDYATSTDILLSTDTKHTGTPPSHSDEHIRIYWETDAVSCYTAATTELLIHNGDESDEPQWSTVSPEDTVDYGSTTDLRIDFEWLVDGGTCKQLIAFVDASAQTGGIAYDATEIQLLGHHSDGDWGFYEFTWTGAYASEDYPARFDVTTTPGKIAPYLHPDDLTRGWSATTKQYLGKTTSDQFSWFSSTGATDTDYRVSINATDKSADAGDYLSNKLSNLETFASGDLPMSWHIENVGVSQTVEFFLDANDVPEFGTVSDPKFLVHNGGQFEFNEDPNTDYRFAVSSSDTADGGNWSTRVENEGVYTQTSEDLLVNWDEYPSGQATLYIDASAISSWGAVSDPKYLTHNGGSWEWRAGTSATDTDYRVAINSGDTADYLDDKFSNLDTMAATDLAMDWHVEGAGDTQTIEFFIDADAVSGWSGGSFPKHLGHNGANWMWYEPTAGGTNTDYRFSIVGDTATAGNWSTRVENEAVYTQTAEDLVINWDEYPSGQATLFVDASVISGWSAGVFPKHLGHNGTQWVWYEPPTGGGLDTDHRFKVYDTDAAQGTWSDKVNTQGGYSQTSFDLKVLWDEHPADEVTLFVNPAIVTDWSGGSFPKHLGHDGSQWRWYEPPAGGGTDTDYRFRISSGAEGTWVERVNRDATSYTSNEDLQISWAELAANATLFVDARTPYYFDTTSDRRYLTHNSGRWEWYNPDFTNTDYRFSISGDTASSGNWSTRVEHEETYTATSEDLWISWDEYPSDQVTLFINASSIPYWATGSYPKHLGHDGTAWRWYEPASGGGTDTDYRFRISSGAEGTWVERVNRYATSYTSNVDLQVSWVELTDNATLFVDARTPYYFDSVSGRKYLTHTGSAWEWVEEPCLVRMNASMSTCNYLEDLIEGSNRSISNASEDLLIDWEVTGGGDSQELQHFINSSKVSNWNSSTNQAIGNTSGGSWYWWDLEDGEFISDLRFGYDSGTGTWQIQVKTKTCKVIGPVVESGWVNKIEHTVC